MIIRFPTGLYKTVLPQKPSDDQSVIFTISSTDPPRSTEVFQELPIAETVKQKEPIINELDRRDSYGGLIFTLDSGSQTLAGSAKKSFEVGQMLDFDQTVESASLTQAPQSVEIRHDTNVLDLEATGLNDAEISELISASEQKKQSLDKELTQIISVMDNIKMAIDENQKDINEVQKTISAAEVALSGSAGTGASGSPIMDKLNAQLDILQEQKQALIDSLASLDTQAGIIRDELLNVSQLVR